MNLIDTHNPDIILELNFGLILIYQVNYSQMVTLLIVMTEKMVMVVFSLPAKNLLLHVV